MALPPLDQLAHHPNPYPWYGRLRACGVHRADDGRYVVARAADVAAVLRDPAAIVGLRPDPNHPLTDLQTQMARFSDEGHEPRRAVAEQALAGLDAERLRTAAHVSTRAALEDESVDVVDLARTVPAVVLASAMGVARPEPTVAAVRQLCVALTPGAASVDPGPGLLDPFGSCPDVAVNRMALLFQTVDATAGLVGSALVRQFREGGSAPAPTLVSEAERRDPPVQRTERMAARDLRIGGLTIPAGSRILVLLASACRDPFAGGSVDNFGAGAHRCPGAALARALATGVIEAVLQDIRRATPAVSWGGDYEPRANLRIPAGMIRRPQPHRSG